MTAVISMSGGCVPPTQPGGATVARPDATPDSKWQGGSQPFRDARPGSWPAS